MMPTKTEIFDDYTLHHHQEDLTLDTQQFHPVPQMFFPSLRCFDRSILALAIHSLHVYIS